jgi:hypothetical protein
MFVTSLKLSGSSLAFSYASAHIAAELYGLVGSDTSGTVLRLKTSFVLSGRSAFVGFSVAWGVFERLVYEDGATVVVFDEYSEDTWSSLTCLESDDVS